MEKSGSSLGDLTAFLALSLDNLGVLLFLSSILVFTFDYPIDIIMTRMIPGTAMGVMAGDLVYSLMALRLRKKTGRADITAMPLGLDTPSTVGLAYAVLGPAYAATGSAVLTWQIGMATLFIIGVVKVITAFLGGWVQRVVPTAGLMGSIAGIGLMLLGFLPLIEIFSSVIVGMVALGLTFYMLIGKMELPGRIPGVVLAVVLGTGLHLLLGCSGMLTDFQKPELALHLALPPFSLDFLQALPQALKYLPIAIPFGIMTIIGGINNTESARLAGDEYRARDILLTEAFSTLAASFFGGVAQTTPYIGHPAYKKMGATYRYTIATGLFIGLGAITGVVPLIVGLVPKAALAPIFIFIGFEIVHQAYASSPERHSPAVSMAFFPAIAGLVMIILNQFLNAAEISPEALPVRLQLMLQALSVLNNGFILTAILWGGMLACLIDKTPRKAGGYALACAVFTLFGLMHSVLPSGEIYLPWQLNTSLHCEIAAGYVLLGGIFFIPARGGE